MNFLKNIQTQPERVRKIILWIIVIVLGFAFLLAWVQGLRQRLEATKEQGVLEELRLPQFEEQFKSLPQIEVPEFPGISEEELKKLEEELKKAEEQAREQ